MSPPNLPPLKRRLVPDEPFPPYSYVTGRFPHPTRDPQGHSFGHLAPTPPRIVPEQWSESRVYLWGCDLFNAGYYWEAHETWEELWHACGRRGTTAEFLKGLIKLAAAGVKAREGRSAGVARHAARALELFEAVRTTIAADEYLGLNLAWLIATTQRLRDFPITPPPNDSPVEVVFDFHLLPA